MGTGLRGQLHPHDLTLGQGYAQGEIGEPHHVPVPPQPEQPVPVEPCPYFLSLGVVRVGQQPLLGSGGQAGLEFVPLPARRGLDPERAETRLDRCVNYIGEI
jgi:hypothetical protein